MPSSLVHYIFAKSSKSEANSAYCLGSQGPDPFFYYGYTSIKAKNTKTIRQFGTFLHKIDPYKIVSFLGGNYEYFYDIYGNFIFQERAPAPERSCHYRITSLDTLF